MLVLSLVTQVAPMVDNMYLRVKLRETYEDLTPLLFFLPHQINNVTLEKAGLIVSPKTQLPLNR